MSRRGLPAVRRAAGAAAAAVLALAVAAAGLPGAAGAADSAGIGSPAAEAGAQFTVLALAGRPVADAAAAVRSAGGTVERANDAVGVITARAGDDGFTARLRESAAVAGVAPVTVVGRAPGLLPAVPGLPELPVAPDGPGPRPTGPKADPLDENLWGLTALRAAQARERQAGDRRVLVGVLDTGVDGTHPDIAPNFSRVLSRNFTTDLPTDPGGVPLDGPCEVKGCVDPADRDDNGHGTHVAGSIAAAADSFGVSGVAPGVRIVNVRGGQDSGLFFLQSVVDAITYSGDAGIDVLNMSFYVDPWAANCPSNPADSPARQAEQQVTIEAMSRAMAYAHGKGVTQIVAFGNANQDPETVRLDMSSPNYPAGSAYPRIVDSSCKDLPRQGPNAITVGAHGPSGAKSGFSNFGPSISVSAPGGWSGDYAGTAEFGAAENQILSAYPRSLALADGAIDRAGALTAAGKARSVLRDCRGDVCGYYQYLQGTSMAAPHAAGVAALIVSEFGAKRGKGFGMDPAAVRRVLEGTARPSSCPDPLIALAAYSAMCLGDEEFNTFFGHGSVDALAAVTRGKAVLARPATAR